jgi:hypothetical protein
MLTARARVFLLHCLFSELDAEAISHLSPGPLLHRLITTGLRNLLPNKRTQLLIPIIRINPRIPLLRTPSTPTHAPQQLLRLLIYNRTSAIPITRILPLGSRAQHPRRHVRKPISIIRCIARGSRHDFDINLPQPIRNIKGTLIHDAPSQRRGLGPLFRIRPTFYEGGGTNRAGEFQGGGERHDCDVVVYGCEGPLWVHGVGGNADDGAAGGVLEGTDAEGDVGGGEGGYEELEGAVCGCDDDAWGEDCAAAGAAVAGGEEGYAVGYEYGALGRFKRRGCREVIC